MAITYLTALNRTLVKLREPQVTAVTGNSDYVTLIAQLVNEAHEEVEESYEWNYQNKTTTITTDGSETYSVTDFGENFTIDLVYDETKNYIIKGPAASESIDRWYNEVDTTLSSALVWGLYGVDSNNDPVIKLYPTPDDVRTLKVFGRVKQGWLEAGSTLMKCPWRPVVLLAYAKAIEERGEDAGMMAERAYMNFERALARAITADANTGHRTKDWSVC